MVDAYFSLLVWEVQISKGVGWVSMIHLLVD